MLIEDGLFKTLYSLCPFHPVHHIEQLPSDGDALKRHRDAFD